MMKTAVKQSYNVNNLVSLTFANIIIIN